MQDICPLNRKITATPSVAEKVGDSAPKEVPSLNINIFLPLFGVASSESITKAARTHSCSVVMIATFDGVVNCNPNTLRAAALIESVCVTRCFREPTC